MSCKRHGKHCDMAKKKLHQPSFCQWKSMDQEFPRSWDCFIVRNPYFGEVSIWSKGFSHVFPIQKNFCLIYSLVLSFLHSQPKKWWLNTTTILRLFTEIKPRQGWDLRILVIWLSTSTSLNSANLRGTKYIVTQTHIIPKVPWKCLGGNVHMYI